MNHNGDESGYMEGDEYNPISNYSRYLYIASRYNKPHFNILPSKYIFCGTRPDLHNFCDYIIRHSLVFGVRSRCSVQCAGPFEPNLNLN